MRLQEAEDEGADVLVGEDDRTLGRGGEVADDGLDGGANLLDHAGLHLDLLAGGAVADGVAEHVFEVGIEAVDEEGGFAFGGFEGDGSLHAGADVFDEFDGVGDGASDFGEGLEDGFEIADGDVFFDEAAEDFREDLVGDGLGGDLVDEAGEDLFELADEPLGFLDADKFLRV